MADIYRNSLYVFAWLNRSALAATEEMNYRMTFPNVNITDVNKQVKPSPKTSR
jgi:hypothetical protein